MSGKKHYITEKTASRHEAVLFSFARARTEFNPRRMFNKMDQGQIIIDQDLWGPQVQGTEIVGQSRAADTVVRNRIAEIFCPPEVEVKSAWLADNGLTHLGPVFEYLGWLFFTGMAGSHRVVIKTGFGFVWIVAHPRHLKTHDECDFGFIATDTQKVDTLITHTLSLTPIPAT